MDKMEMIQRLKERMRQVTPLPDEEDFATADETAGRYLKAFEWKYNEAEAGLLQTIEYRRASQPLRSNCSWCHNQPGFHSMRQVGHDESGRPVVYANFAQACARKNTADDVVAHVTYLIENAKATMDSGVSTWVFIIDCTGMSINVCRPKVGLRGTSLLSSHYPERLGMVICVHHNPIFHAFWKAIKAFLAPNTVSKMRLLRSEAKIKQSFSTFFSDELSAWLWEEMSLNKAKPLSHSQKHFWAAPANAGDHDPRGCASYVRKYLNGFDPARAEFIPGQEKAHCPHPNIVCSPEQNSLSSSDGDAISGASQMDDDEEELQKRNISADEELTDERPAQLELEARRSSEHEQGEKEEEHDEDVSNLEDGSGTSCAHGGSHNGDGGDSKHAQERNAHSHRNGKL